MTHRWWQGAAIQSLPNVQVPLPAPLQRCLQCSPLNCLHASHANLCTTTMHITAQPGYLLLDHNAQMPSPLSQARVSDQTQLLIR